MGREKALAAIDDLAIRAVCAEIDLASLPVDRFPNVISLAGPLTAGSGGDERFEFGLDVLVRGLAALVPAS